MHTFRYTGGDWLALVQHEALLFAAVFFAVGVIDELAVDLWYVWLRVSGRATTRRVNEKVLAAQPLSGRAAVFIPAWREAAVIGHTLAHALSAWPRDEVTIYVGCYQNDPETIAVVEEAFREDPRVKLVVTECDGPTSTADCLNRIYTSLCEDEARSGEQTRFIILHDAEDMVDPAALPVLDRGLDAADFLQLPVIALPQAKTRWVGNHYSDEFAESHAKTMVVRSALGAGIPGAGVGCAIARPMLDMLARGSAHGQPFASESLTEDYELGLRIAALGGRTQFLRLRTTDGRLIGTRAFFPSRFEDSVRQKTRWMHGIALQSWDRLGWFGSPISVWMQLRDRRGPFAALLLLVAYALMPVVLTLLVADYLELLELPALSPVVSALLIFNVAGLVWRVLVRSAFTTREFGWRVGLMAIPRMAVSNVIAIVAGYRALAAYIGTLRGSPIRWHKTEHHDHPALTFGWQQRA